MNHSIEPGLVPPPRGLDKEEPELNHNEEDIPSDDGGRPAGSSEAAREERPLRDVERE